MKTLGDNPFALQRPTATAWLVMNLIGASLFLVVARTTWPTFEDPGSDSGTLLYGGLYVLPFGAIALIGNGAFLLWRIYLGLRSKIFVVVWPGLVSVAIWVGAFAYHSYRLAGLR
jgi:hypothetical protein